MLNLALIGIGVAIPALVVGLLMAPVATTALQSAWVIGFTGLAFWALAKNR